MTDSVIKTGIDSKLSKEELGKLKSLKPGDEWQGMTVLSKEEQDAIEALARKAPDKTDEYMASPDNKVLPTNKIPGIGGNKRDKRKAKLAKKSKQLNRGKTK